MSLEIFNTILLFVLVSSSLAIFWLLIKIWDILDRDKEEISQKARELEIMRPIAPLNDGDSFIYEWQPPKTEMEILAEKVMADINK